MALSVASSGSQTATIGTEHTLYSTATAGSYVLRVDTSNMALGDTLYLSVKTPVLSGGTSRLLYRSQPISNVQAEPIFQTIVVVAPFGADFTLRQSAGTGRAYPWSVERFAAPTVASSGTQTATLNTNHQLYTTTTSGVYVVTCDLNALTGQERVLLTIGQKIRTGDSVTTAYKRLYRYAQGSPIKQSPPIVAPFGLTVTLRQELGTGRAFPWSVATVG